VIVNVFVLIKNDVTKQKHKQTWTYRDGRKKKLDHLYAYSGIISSQLGYKKMCGTILDFLQLNFPDLYYTIS
jgi:hypothetical protein